MLPSTATIKALVDLHLFVEPHAARAGCGNPNTAISEKAVASPDVV
jgi:hypothetical protein